VQNNIKLYEQSDIDRLIQNEVLDLPYDFNEKDLYNVIMDYRKSYMYETGLHAILDFMRKPENFYYTCKWIFNITLASFQVSILQELWNRKFPMVIGSRGCSKTFLLGLYALLRAFFTQNSKIIIVGAAFRQSKLIFEYMETIWSKSPTFRSFVPKAARSGPRRDIDRCNFNIGESEAIAIPLGTGEKIRGLRAHYTLVDEFDAINQEIFEVVIRGFSSVSASPTEKMESAARIKILKSFGMYLEAEEIEKGFGFGNQTVLTGTAGYGFSHFYDYWQKYKDIIESCGEKRRLEEVFQGDVPEGFNWKDFSVFRIPYTLLPDMFMDKTTIAGSEATMHKALFQMEYCVSPETKIMTDVGAIRIDKIKIGDKVLTHKGRFKSVVDIFVHDINDDIYDFKTLGYNQNILITKEHPFWYGDDNFGKFNCKNTCLTNLKELNNKIILNLEDYCFDYLETKDGNNIYAKPRSAVIDLEIQRYIRNSNKSIKELSKELILRYNTVWNIKNNVKYFKSCIPKFIMLNEQFGRIVGYYASEGSRGSNGKSISFALDEHNDTQYIKQLCNDIYDVFGYDAKIYTRDDNTTNVIINNKLVVQLMSKICLGICYDKFILSSVLFSNECFIKGFLEGYFNGDGHLRFDGGNSSATAFSVSEKLITQVRMSLSYFGIGSSILFKSGGKSKFYEREIDVSDSYIIKMTGNNFRKFICLCYDLYEEKINKVISNSPKINNNGKYLELPVIENTLTKYKGKVYNLAVADDNSYSLYNATVHNCGVFCADSGGFFPRSLIESCVCKQPIELPSGLVKFSAVTFGSPNFKYVYGIDPASERDNFAIIILEVHPDHSRIVYCWTIKRDDLRRRKIKDNNRETFYNYCAKKIRMLTKIFPTEYIGIDSQGGGIAVIEALRDENLLEDNKDLPMLPYIKKGKDDPLWWEQEDKSTDGEAGIHNLCVINFANAVFISKANHGLKQDFEQKTCLFPFFDSATIAESITLDKIANREYDTLEDCVMEVEELKDELTTITYTRTAAGRDKWDVPDIKLPGHKKGRLRKDRYSALVIANMIARTIQNQSNISQHNFVGGYVGQKKSNTFGKMYVGPAHIVDKMNSVRGYGAIRR